MARIVIPIYFDYASTLCYVAWRIVGELEQELEFAPLWKGVPIRLRSHASSPGNPLGQIEQAKIASVIAQTGIDVAPPQSWIDSDAALIGSELARQANAFEAFHDGVFRAAFELREDISNLECLGGIAAAAGMDSAAFCRDVKQRLTADEIMANKREADNFSALGYPTFMLGEYPLIGIQPKETMRLLFQRYLAQRRSMPPA